MSHRGRRNVILEGSIVVRTTWRVAFEVGRNGHQGATTVSAAVATRSDDRPFPVANRQRGGWGWLSLVNAGKNKDYQ